MLPGSGIIQIAGENLSTPEVNNICESLGSNGIRFLSLRECTFGDKECKSLMKAIGLCKSILQLNLSLGVVNNRLRVELVSQAIIRNRSLRSLSLHGNKLGDEGVRVICQALTPHPCITSLDLGDCGFGDAGLEAVCDLLPPSESKPGLHDLILSANTDVTARGWAKLSMAIGVTSMLKALYLDYNNLGDYGAGCLAVSLAANRQIEILDLEGTQLTEHSAKLYLHLVKSYPMKLKRLVLRENRVHKSTVEAIRNCLQDFEDNVNDNDVNSESDYQTFDHALNDAEVKVRSVEFSPKNHSEKEQGLKGMAQLMNSPEAKHDKHRPQKSTTDREESMTAVHKSGEYTSPKRSTELPQRSNRKGGGKHQHKSLRETEEWGEELNEVPL